ncbi:2-phospho-L-lactate guanylyltransferase [Novosphingobium resinovorum]|uniref:2-phospho-L-lactate guanylyltransferase n=1 Tax=Novosphingobium resinovorum TaxID=158500 RepID=UPI002ED50968|nr:2-phospho-L-lactate guanylyltransferase [Novosphingobium resinovorum]
MTTWALIPVKPRGEGKSRLAPALSPQRRGDLVEAMLARVIAACGQAADRTILLGPPRAALPFVPDPGEGLNAALAHALGILGRGPSPERLIVVAGDLPCLHADEVRRLAALPADAVGIATDRHGTGTNALSLPLPRAAAFRFHYGTGSAALHHAAAQALGLNAVTITAPGLAKDIDEPADLADAELLFDLAN